MTETEENNTILFDANNKSLTHEEIWDDTLLIQRYDEIKAKVDRKAKKQSAASASETENSEVGPSEAMSEVKADESTPNNLNKKNKNKKKRKPKKKQEWQIGDFCRWRYSEDGMIYEAAITAIDAAAGTCNIRYIGYNNEEVVTTRHIMRSLGDRSRQRQVDAAEAIGSDVGGDLSSVLLESDLQSDPGDVRTNKRQRLPPSFPQNMPHLPNLPPPPALGLGFTTGDGMHAEALHTMLMSWYMTGYHTGYYQGIQKAEKTKKR